MSDGPLLVNVADARRRTLDLYLITMLLMLVGIAVLIVYAIELGPLTSPGAEQSFGFAVALIFLQGAIVAHIIDRSYRVWPLGRKVAARMPNPITDASLATFLKALTVVAVIAAVAYILGGLLLS